MVERRDPLSYGPEVFATIEQQLGKVSELGFAKVFASLVAEGRVHPFTEEAVVHIFGAEHAATMLAKNPIASMEGGYISIPGSPGEGHLFLKDGRLNAVSATVVHETVHYLQDLHRKQLTKFTSELQAWLAQRDYLIQLEKAGGTVPADMVDMMRSTNGELADSIVETYKLEFTNILDAAKHTRTVMAMVQTFREGAGPAKQLTVPVQDSAVPAQEPAVPAKKPDKADK
jgi:hypothetical protein